MKYEKNFAVDSDKGRVDWVVLWDGLGGPFFTKWSLLKNL